MPAANSRRGHPNPPRPPKLRICYFAVFGHIEPWTDGTVIPMPKCDGKLVKCHVIKRTVLRAAGAGRHVEWCDGAWVWGCGGPMGNAGHHGMYDSFKLRLPRSAVPEDTERLAHELGLDWYIDKHFGPKAETNAATG